MGTTLTGTKPKDTYDSLIKVEDNGPISGTAKYLSDGLGNNLPIAVSTSNVGIGTSAPTTKLTVGGVIRLLDGSLTGTGGVELSSEAFYGFAAQATAYKFRNSSNTATYISVDSDGLKFGSDTAAANALDDYEEGTWTIGVSFGGASVGVTTSSNTGTYTKIGRQVTVNGYLALTNKGSSTGAAKIKGLPFTVGNTTGNLAAAAARFDSITFANQFQIHAEDNTTTMALEEITEAGAVTTLSNSDFANSCSVLLSCTYFV